MSDRTLPSDPLANSFQSPDRSFLDRTFYATGVLLDATDFQTEQLYHRGRLARTLAYLHGSGTAAGLEVTWSPATDATDSQPAQPEKITVAPGLAVDYMGRLIEIPPRGACLCLNRWYEQQTDQDLRQGFHTGIQSGDIAAPTDGVVVDIFLRFILCERGKTPAFAAGPFDALDAVQPERLRDGYELQFLIRPESEPPLPQSPWPEINQDDSLEARRTTLHQGILGAWREGTEFIDDDGNRRSTGAHVNGEDTTAVFLARVVIPATQADSTARPERVEAADVQIDNLSRPFVYSTAAIARLTGLDTHPTPPPDNP